MTHDLPGAFRGVQHYKSHVHVSSCQSLMCNVHFLSRHLPLQHSELMLQVSLVCFLSAGQPARATQGKTHHASAAAGMRIASEPCKAAAVCCQPPSAQQRCCAVHTALVLALVSRHMLSGSAQPCIALHFLKMLLSVQSLVTHRGCHCICRCSTVQRCCKAGCPASCQGDSLQHNTAQHSTVTGHPAATIKVC